MGLIGHIVKAVWMGLIRAHCVYDLPQFKDGLLSRFTDPKFDAIPQVQVLSTFANTVLCMKVRPLECCPLCCLALPENC